MPIIFLEEVIYNGKNDKSLCSGRTRIERTGGEHLRTIRHSLVECSNSNITEEQLDTELNKGYDDYLYGRTKTAIDAVAEIRKDYELWSIACFWRINPKKTWEMSGESLRSVLFILRLVNVSFVQNCNPFGIFWKRKLVIGLLCTKYDWLIGPPGTLAWWFFNAVNEKINLLPNRNTWDILLLTKEWSEANEHRSLDPWLWICRRPR